MELVRWDGNAIGPSDHSDPNKKFSIVHFRPIAKTVPSKWQSERRITQLVCMTSLVYSSGHPSSLAINNFYATPSEICFSSLYNIIALSLYYFRWPENVMFCLQAVLLEHNERDVVTPSEVAEELKTLLTAYPTLYRAVMYYNDVI